MTEQTPDSRLAMVFPGQGSQSVGMLAELAGAYPAVRETFAEASDVLGYDLWRLVQEGPETELNRTDQTQPAMLAAGVAVWRVWRQRDGVVPAVVAGHSLGEYTALVCAGALELAPAVGLVAARGRLMQEAVPAGEGAMAAVLGLDDATVAGVCEAAAGGEVVQPVNFNAPGQVVVAGDTAAVERAMEAARAAGAKRVVKLSVSVPSHCDLMRPAAEAFAQQLEQVTLHAPRMKVLHNVDAAARDDVEAIRDALARQLYNPVRWVDTVRAMTTAGAMRVVECGPGKVLAGLLKRIDRNLEALAVHDAASLDAALAAATVEA